MSPKQIIISPNAEKEIKKLQKNDQKLVFKHLARLENGTSNLCVEKIKSHPAFYRIKAAHLRLIYYPLSMQRVVLLLVRNRKDAYKGLNSIDQRLETAITNIEKRSIEALKSY